MIKNVNLTTEADTYLAGHNIDGRVLFPATGYMCLAWNSYVETLGKDVQKTAVVLEDVIFHRATILPKDGTIKFGISISTYSGTFEICESGSLVVSGKISIPENVEKEQLSLKFTEKETKGLPLNTNDIYKELRLRGYDYGGVFQGIHNANASVNSGELKWEQNWVSFMDTMLQFSILGKDLRELYLPTRIQKVTIDPQSHFNQLETAANAQTTVLPVFMHKNQNVIKSGGVEMRGLKASLAPRRSGAQQPTLEKYEFVPLVNTKDFSENFENAREHALSVAVHLALENSSGALKVKVVEVAKDKMPENILAPLVQQIIGGEPLLASEVFVVSSHAEEVFAQTLPDVQTGDIKILNKPITNEPIEQNCHLLMAYDVLVASAADRSTLMNCFKQSIRSDGFILLEESATACQASSYESEFSNNYQLITISKQKCGQRVFILLRPECKYAGRQSTVLHVSAKNFDYVEVLKAALAEAESTNTYLYLVCCESTFGAVGFLNCLKNENGGKYIRLVFVQSEKCEPFSLSSRFYVEQLKKDLISNVYKNGCWGTYRHLKLDCQSNAQTLSVEHAYVNALTKGDLASLKWIEGPLSRARLDVATADKNLELCTVYYAPINFRDVMLTSGKLSADALPGDLAQQDCVLGLEVS
jgi:fatty acid synthase, animal type